MRLNPKAKPEQCASQDGTRPAFDHVWLQDGRLYATDSYVALRMAVTDTEQDTDGMVPEDPRVAPRSF